MSEYGDGDPLHGKHEDGVRMGRGIRHDTRCMKTSEGLVVNWGKDSTCHI